MDSNFVKTENDNDIDNDVETEAKVIHSVSATNLEKWTNLERMRLSVEKH